jgi:hypothetical protein
MAKCCRAQWMVCINHYRMLLFELLGDQML